MGFENFNQINPEVVNLSEEEKKERIQNIEREKLGQEFDSSQSELKEALKDVPELYEEQKKTWVEEKIKQEEEFDQEMEEVNQDLAGKAQEIKEADKREADFDREMEEFNLMMEQAVQEKREAMIDSVTGLEIRPGLYRRMEAAIRDLFSDEETKDSDSFIEAIKNSDIDFSKEDLTVVFGDISFLSLANKAGHDVGDGLLSDVAKKVKNEGVQAFRHGGDELTVFCKSNKKELKEAVGRIEEGVAEIENPANLKSNYGLDANIDIGVAHFSEAVEVFKNLVDELSKTEEGEQVLKSMDSVRELQDIWIKIADQRAFLKKGETRIPLLIKIKKEDPENYKEVIGSLRKGGYDATDAEIDYLGGVAKKDQEKIIKLFIVQKEKKILAGKDDFYEHVRSELILKKALENN